MTIEPKLCKTSAKCWRVNMSSRCGQSLNIGFKSCGFHDVSNLVINPACLSIEYVGAKERTNVSSPVHELRSSPAGVSVATLDSHMRTTFKNNSVTRTMRGVLKAI